MEQTTRLSVLKKGGLILLPFRPWSSLFVVGKKERKKESQSKDSVIAKNGIFSITTKAKLSAYCEMFGKQSHGLMNIFMQTI